MNASTLVSANSSKSIRIGLWVSQILLALVYVPAGSMKLFAPVVQVAANIPWAGDVPEAFLRFIGVVDLSAGLGVLLPALTRIYPGLTVYAAQGSIALQICAMVFHASRGEYMVIPFNLFIIGLSAFVAWGRKHKAPVLPR